MEPNTWYHKYNVLKYRILTTLYKAKLNGEGALTCQQIADRIGVDRKKITETLSKWSAYKYRYTRRLSKKAKGSNGKAFRYIITSYGLATLRMYEKRISQGKDLNCKSAYKPARDIESYIGIKQKGLSLGITTDDIWDEMKSVIAERQEQVENY